VKPLPSRAAAARASNPVRFCFDAVAFAMDRSIGISPLVDQTT